MPTADTFRQYLGWCPDAPMMRTAPAVLVVPPETVYDNRPDGSGSGGSPGRVRQGIRIAAGRIQAMARNRYLLWFSFLSGLMMLCLIGTVVWGIRHADGTRQFLLAIPLGTSVITFDARIFLAELLCLSCFNLLLACLVVHRNEKPVTIQEVFGAIDAHAGALAALSVAMAFIATILVEIVSGNTWYIGIAGGFQSAAFRLPYAYVLDELPAMLYLGFEMIFINIVLCLAALCLVPLVVRDEKGLFPALVESIAIVRGTWREILGCILVYGTIVLGTIAAALAIGQLPGLLYDQGVHSMYYGHLLLEVTCYGFILACWCLMVVCCSAAGAAIADLDRAIRSERAAGGCRPQQEIAT
jgi:hypothetical protein